MPADAARYAINNPEDNMPEAFRDPSLLADAVRSALQRKRKKAPSSDILDQLFRVMYHTSMRTEEGRTLQFGIVYINPRDPDPNPPKNPSNDRWTFIPLGEELPFQSPIVAKLALATDPRTSSLAVFIDDENELKIWGFIDQETHIADYINYEIDSGPECPGLFQAYVEGTGSISATIGYQKIADLRIGRLITTSTDVWSSGPVRGFLNIPIKRYINKVKEKIPPGTYYEREHWDSILTSYWISIIPRLLLRVRRYRHGGALLIVRDTNPLGLTIKYSMIYGRLMYSLRKYGRFTVEETKSSDDIFDYLNNDETEIILKDHYLSESVAASKRKEVRLELSSALWFVSLLTRVDGLVLLNRDLVVKGFGAEIRVTSVPPSIWKSATPIPGSRLTEVDYEHYGTRHRSMMRYCWKYPKALGFVVSQDGDVRAILRVDDRLIIWDNVKLELPRYIPKKKRKKIM